jgi:hypothetical protein
MAHTLPHGFVTGKITKTVLAYLEAQAGPRRRDNIVDELVKRTNCDRAALTEAESKMHMDVCEALYPLVCDELRDPDAIYKAGLFSANMQAVGMFVFGMVKLLGGIPLVYRKAADIAPRFANTGVMTCADVTANRAIMEFFMFPGLNCTKLGCDYRKGLLAACPLSFGKKVPATIEHPHCQAKGAEKDVYVVSWT